MIVVTDTSPLNYLIIIQTEFVLPVLYGRVLAPPAVIDEMRHAKAPSAVRLWAASPPEWLSIVRPSTVDETLQLGQGESEAISLASEIEADALLIDDRQAAAIAARRGQRVVGTLALLEVAAEQRLIDLRATFAQLLRTNFRCPVPLMEEMLRRHEQRARSN